MKSALKPHILVFDQFLSKTDQKAVQDAFLFLAKEDLFYFHNLNDRQKKFSYRYTGFPILGLEQGETPNLARLYRSPGMRGFRSFVKRLQKFMEIQGADLLKLKAKDQFEFIAMSATKYHKGHFLSTHTDGTNNDYAFIYYPAEHWKSDWGGDLVFLKDHQPLARHSPCGNRLVIFRVPQQHLIEKIKTQQPRIAISGWINFKRQK
jgi:Rps23 Pro-64 3,4-dihydroxylase Tpa1-like proline 4-hydroxylase